MQSVRETISSHYCWDCPRIESDKAEEKIEAGLIAREVGVSRQALWKWETGRTNPTKKNARKIVQVYSRICGCDM